jgi:hypothetical protein
MPLAQAVLPMNPPETAGLALWRVAGQRFFSGQRLDPSRLPLSTATAHFHHPCFFHFRVGLVGNHLEQAIGKLGAVFVVQLHGLGKDLIQGRHGWGV